MQDIASENRLSETAFVVKENNGWKLRWFTPGGEIDLCGHATLATAFVLMNFVEPDLSEIEFSILSGKLSVKKKNELYEMDFPPYELKRVEVTEAMEAVRSLDRQRLSLYSGERRSSYQCAAGS